MLSLIVLNKLFNYYYLTLIIFMLSLNKNKFYEIYPDWSKDVYKQNNINKYPELGSMTNEHEIINHFLKNDSLNCKYSLLPEKFNIDVYKYYNFDLLNLSDNQLIRHYIQNGQSEKRLATIDDFYKVNPDFDRLFYITLYGDLKHLSIHNLIKHYLYFGRFEKRLIGPQDFHKRNPNFNKSITDINFIVNYIVNNKPIEDKLKKLEINSFTEEQFYDEFYDWNFNIYSTFNFISITMQESKQTEILKYMNDFVIKLTFNLKKKSEQKIIYSLKTFYEVFSSFNYKKYRSNNFNNFIGLSEIDVIIHWYKNDYNRLYNSKCIQTYDIWSNNDKFDNQFDNQFNNNFDNNLDNNFDNNFDKKIDQLQNFDEVLIYVHDEFKSNDGGVVVQYYLGSILDHYGIKTRIYSSVKNKYNSIFNNYYDDNFNLDKTVVIYCEGIIGNPLNAKYVVRWLLSELGKNVPENRYLTWDKNELIYYFNREAKFDIERIKVDVIYKYLPLLFVDPVLFTFNNQKAFSERTEYCFVMRKCHAYHKEINYIHPSNSAEIKHQTTFKEAINIFLTHKYFISYDPLTFYQIIAILCGCVCIVYPLNGITKKEWLKQTALWPYIEKHNVDIYGLAYGTDIDELNNAELTLPLAQKQWIDIMNYNKNLYIKRLVEDLNNFDKSLNTVKNNFFLNNLN